MTGRAVAAASLAALLSAPSAWAAPAAGARHPSKQGGAVSVVERDVVDVAPEKGTPITEIHIDNRLGSISVEGHDGPGVTIYAVKRAPDDAALDRLKVELVPNPNGPIRISTSLLVGNEARPIPAGAARIDLAIKAPRNARVQAQVWNGRVSVSDMDNGAELTANEGDIEVKDVSGHITTHNASGQQKFHEVFGAIDAQGIIGAMDMNVVRGERLDAELNKGRIVGRKVRVREVSLRTTIGDIELRGSALAGGRYRFASFRGDINVRFGGRAPISVRAVSRRGRVILAPAFHARRDPVTGAYLGRAGSGRSPAAVELRSQIGNIRLALANDFQP